MLLTLLNVSLVAPLVTALTLSFSEVLRRSVPWIVLPKIGPLPRWGAFVLIVVAMDGCNWFAHLANHRVRMLWRFHELHHSQEDMNVLTVFRTHPLIHVSYLIALIPGVLLLANGAISSIFLVVYGGNRCLRPLKHPLDLRPLGRVFVSPNYHRIHHRLDGRQDVNLGFALTIWDQLFHTAVFPTPETVGIATGLPGRPLMVEQAGSVHAISRSSVAQLIAPFRPLSPPVDPTRVAPSKSEVGVMVTATLQPNRRSARALLTTVVKNAARTALPADAALIACRIALAWIFIYYGAGKLFGAFNGPGIHTTAIYFSSRPISTGRVSSPCSAD